MAMWIGRKTYPCTTLVGHLWTFIKLLCLSLVILQTALTIKGSFYSGKTVTTSTVQKLKDSTFPVVFNIIVKPGFDELKLEELGYTDAYWYFMGKNILNASWVGWKGHGKSFNNVSGQ